MSSSPPVRWPLGSYTKLPFSPPALSLFHTSVSGRWGEGGGARTRSRARFSARFRGPPDRAPPLRSTLLRPNGFFHLPTSFPPSLVPPTPSGVRAYALSSTPGGEGGCQSTIPDPAPDRTRAPPDRSPPLRYVPLCLPASPAPSPPQRRRLILRYSSRSGTWRSLPLRRPAACRFPRSGREGSPRSQVGHPVRSQAPPAYFSTLRAASLCPSSFLR